MPRSASCRIPTKRGTTMGQPATSPSSEVKPYSRSTRSASTTSSTGPLEDLPPCSSATVSEDADDSLSAVPADALHAAVRVRAPATRSGVRRLGRT